MNIPNPRAFPINFDQFRTTLFLNIDTYHGWVPNFVFVIMKKADIIVNDIRKWMRDSSIQGDEDKLLV
ncbi:hypothetical protein RIR_jg41656.t1 [Rhizophagus irregularis DAOM 181602=DAOM 197198]|nr:hypothetical protein RIR_jg41656.t1 [Rhizophagus irregularis DAOM 181602=DAOM 197198]